MDCKAITRESLEIPINAWVVSRACSPFAMLLSHEGQLNFPTWSHTVVQEIMDSIHAGKPLRDHTDLFASLEFIETYLIDGLIYEVKEIVRACRGFSADFTYDPQVQTRSQTVLSVLKDPSECTFDWKRRV